ncbi:hypothetical protein AKJ16_DCAP11349 [Drosera capensis]
MKEKFVCIEFFDTRQSLAFVLCVINFEEERLAKLVISLAAYCEIRDPQEFELIPELSSDTAVVLCVYIGSYGSIVFNIDSLMLPRDGDHHSSWNAFLNIFQSLKICSLQPNGARNCSFYEDF